MSKLRGLPRMRGDRPVDLHTSPTLLMFTPHARGSTFTIDGCHGYYVVYPACAGIDPIKFAENPCALRLPRMRGDRP